MSQMANHEVFVLFLFNYLFRFSYTDERLSKLVHLIEDHIRYYYIVTKIPFMRYIAPRHYFMKEIKKIFTESINEHQKNKKKDQNDFIDEFLKEMSTSSATNFTTDDLLGLCTDLFDAGGETVGSTLRWAILYLTHYPHVQVCH